MTTTIHEKTPCFPAYRSVSPAKTPPIANATEARELAQVYQAEAHEKVPTGQKKTGRRRALMTLGVVILLAGLGCLSLLFIGLLGGTAGSTPTASNLTPVQQDQTTSDVTPTKEVPARTEPTTAQEDTGPADKTLYLTVPKLGLEDVAVHDSLSEEKLKESLIHLPGTGFPWQTGTNTYIAGHRMGYFGTGSFLVFFRLNELDRGDDIILKDSAGQDYLYRVTETLVVAPEDVDVVNSTADKSMVSLQTCTLPDFSDRLVVRGELVS